MYHGLTAYVTRLTCYVRAGSQSFLALDKLSVPWVLARFRKKVRHQFDAPAIGIQASLYSFCTENLADGMCTKAVESRSFSISDCAGCTTDQSICMGVSICTGAPGTLCTGSAVLLDTEHTGPGMNGVSVARPNGRIGSVDITGGIAAFSEPEDTRDGNKCACVDDPAVSWATL